MRIFGQGRNTKLENIWRKIFFWKNTSTTQGTQRPLVPWYDFETDVDLEIPEVVVRNDLNYRAEKLIYIKNNCGFVSLIFDTLCRLVEPSADGDDQGFAIADTLNDNVTPVNPQVKEILDNLIRNRLSGNFLARVLENLLAYGDCFVSIQCTKNNQVTPINNLLILPTWQMFRRETSQGELLGFQQRPSLYSNDDELINFHPLTCCHFRFRQDKLYGRALFYEMVDLIMNFIALEKDIADAVRVTAVNPRVHELSCDATSQQVKEYVEAYQKRLSKGPIYDYFIKSGENIKPFSTTPPNINALLEYRVSLLKEIGARSLIPPWLLGLETTGARELSGEPSKFFSTVINDLRATLTEGLKHIMSLELALHGLPESLWGQYRIIFPRFYVNPVSSLNPEEPQEINKNTIEDLD